MIAGSLLDLSQKVFLPFPKKKAIQPTSTRLISVSALSRPVTTSKGVLNTWHPLFVPNQKDKMINARTIQRVPS
jgi:hypothetical protein